MLHLFPIRVTFPLLPLYLFFGGKRRASSLTFRVLAAVGENSLLVSPLFSIPRRLKAKSNAKDVFEFRRHSFRHFWTTTDDFPDSHA